MRSSIFDLRDRAHDLTDDLAFFEDEEGRDAADVVLGREIGVRVDVALADADLAVVVLGERLDVGRDRAARRAPHGPEVHEHRQLRRPQDLSLEVAVGDLDDVLASHGASFSTAPRRLQGPEKAARRPPWYIYRVSPLTALGIRAYALASLLYVSFLLGFLAGMRDRLARAVLALAVVMHLFDIGVRCLHGTNPLASTPEAMSFISFLLAAGYLLASLRYGLASAGAFAAPAALVLLLLARVVPAEAGTPAMGPLGYTHILLATSRGRRRLLRGRRAGRRLPLPGSASSGAGSSAASRSLARPSTRWTASRRAACRSASRSSPSRVVTGAMADRAPRRAARHGDAPPRVPAGVRDLGGVRRARSSRGSGGGWRRRMTAPGSGGLRGTVLVLVVYFLRLRGRRPIRMAGKDFLYIERPRARCVAPHGARRAAREAHRPARADGRDAPRAQVTLPGVREVALLNTCSRVEIYAVTSDAETAMRAMSVDLARRAGMLEG